jgi:hypothetical protein
MPTHSIRLRNAVLGLAFGLGAAFAFQYFAKAALYC